MVAVNEILLRLLKNCFYGFALSSEVGFVAGHAGVVNIVLSWFRIAQFNCTGPI